MASDAFELVFSVLERKEYRVLTADMTQITAAEKILRVVWQLDAEVKNGGFLQYFANPSGENAKLLVESLTAIGCEAVVSIVQQALSLFPDDLKWQDESQRSDCLYELGEDDIARLSALDLLYYEHDDHVIDLLSSYILQCPSAFDLGPIH